MSPRRIFTKTRAVTIIFLLALLLRLINLKQNFVFGVDEEYQAYLAQTIVKDFHLIWIGVGSTADFYLGPFWTYLTAFLLFISNGTPLITGYFSAILGAVTTVMVFWVGKKLNSVTVGIIASLLYALLPLFVLYDQKFWNVSLTPLLSLVMLYSLLKLKEQPWWLTVFALAYGLVFHTHLSLIFFGPVALFWIVSSKIQINAKVVFISIATFLAVYSPLLVFDYFHNWSNLATPIRLVTTARKQVNPVKLTDKIGSLSNYLGRLWYLKPYQNSADEVNWGCTYSQSQSSGLLKTLSFGLLFLLFIVIIVIKARKNANTRLLVITIMVYLAMFLVFPGNVYEYYLLGFFPLYLFVPVIVFDWSRGIGKRLIFVLLIIICLLGVRTVLTTKGTYGLGVKRQLIGEVMKEVDGKPFSLFSEGKCHIAEGWRYLFGVYGRKPVSSDTDRIFGWLYPNEISDTSVIYNVTINESRILLPDTIRINNVRVVERGGFTAYISK